MTKGLRVVKATKPIRLPIDDVIGEVLARPEIVKMIKVNGRIAKQGKLEQIVLPKTVEGTELIPVEYMDLLKEVGVVEKEDADVMWINFQKLQALRTESEEAKKFMETIATKYGIDVKRLLAQIESLKVIVSE